MSTVIVSKGDDRYRVPSELAANALRDGWVLDDDAARIESVAGLSQTKTPDGVTAAGVEVVGVPASDDGASTPVDLDELVGPGSGGLPLELRKKVSREMKAAIALPRPYEGAFVEPRPTLTDNRRWLYCASCKAPFVPRGGATTCQNCLRAGRSG